MRACVWRTWLSVALTTALAGACGQSAAVSPLTDPGSLRVAEERVDVALRDATVDDALRVLARTARINIFAPVTSFRGERIAARFDDTPIGDVAKALATVAKATIVVDDGVQADITLHLRLPWDLALYHLAQKYELRIVRTDSELRIAHR